MVALPRPDGSWEEVPVWGAHDGPPTRWRDGSRRQDDPRGDEGAGQVPTPVTPGWTAGPYGVLGCP
jgi:hypothetical protein